MFLDRDLQLELLRKMASAYPCSYHFTEEVISLDEDDLGKFYANLFYLQSHGLLEPNGIMLSIGIGKGNYRYTLGNTRLTVKGIDFLADDGGLSAILNVVTVKFEAEQLKEILEAKVSESDLPNEEKNLLIDGLRSLSAESIKHLTMKVLDSGWDNLGGLIRLIQNNLF